MTHADKRSVSTDALETLGMIHTKEEKRDAIHLAVLPVEAGEDLARAQPITIREGKAYLDVEGIGIVDPFIDKGVGMGQKFWMVLRPRIITSLRHVWTHPAFEDEPEVKEVAPESTDQKTLSERWLRDWVNREEVPDYDTVISLAKSSSGEDYITIFGEDAHATIPAEFWDHLYNVTGERVIDPPEGFSCSC